VTGNVVARRYAKAMVETVGEQEGDYEAVHAELRGLAAVIDGHRDLRHFLYSPSVRLDVKGEIMGDLLERVELSPISSTFVKLLLEKGRLRYLGSIAETFGQMANERMGRLKVTVSSATPLTKTNIKKLSTELKKQDIKNKHEDDKIKKLNNEGEVNIKHGAPSVTLQTWLSYVKRLAP